ncbi:hypothetical protein I5U30_00985 [Stenotrophomonas maltophilia]|jgi:hypothetical protein|nr:hypothetical protein [Stenotrophomonas maltophilia]
MELADIRAYQRQLILFCLGIHGDSTAAEALELMGNAALEVGAPREAMLLTTAAAAGLLRELDRDGLVRRCENRDSGRDGRPVATWAVTDSGRVDTLPLPPSGQQQLAMPQLAPAPAHRTRGGLSLDQLMGLLNIEFDCMLEQMDREHQAAQQRARQEFDAFRQRAMRVWGASEASV